ncbi:hypothetical protein AVEN_268675-1 [Araneus ventricosus]|uniref:Uncharacterized protein n=1 Tax=Araneus ventricosus TaxID=182803 RepID=A0A4Y2BKW5_ARAVE|nr:hypothetical protein AVEN_252756-1 [Araneus ventricosus]GBL92364.1 hypothetical protein AVEN_268675-1 [Araneus ventricosus]
MRSCWISKRVLASPGDTIMGELCYPPPEIVRTSYRRGRPWSVMTTKAQASVFEVLQRLSFTGPWMPRQDRGNMVCGLPKLSVPISDDT